jgi:hypothetical protein
MLIATLDERDFIIRGQAKCHPLSRITSLPVSPAINDRVRWRR